MAELELRLPDLKDESEFLRAYEATKVSDPNFAHYYKAEMKYLDWVNVIKYAQQGVGLPSDLHVASTFLLGWVNGKIIGRVSIRHSLNEFLLNYGGHIGYVVVPDERRKGFATEMLRQSLKISKDMGINRALLTCDEGNTGSQKTIEKCGGVLENIISAPNSSVRKMRFWIDI